MVDDGEILPLLVEALDGPGSGIIDESFLPFNHIQKYYDITGSLHTLTKDEIQLFSTCSVVIGMHSDEATESIIDTALAFHLPFAVVPCCVFTNLFPNRRKADGEPVRTYTELVEYLQSKDASIRIALLPSFGRNIVLYRLEGGS